MAIKHLPLPGSPKFTQSVIFGFKTNYLATLRTIESFADMSEKEFANICKPLHECTTADAKSDTKNFRDRQSAFYQ
jgi:hypothetical protein